MDTNSPVFEKTANFFAKAFGTLLALPDNLRPSSINPENWSKVKSLTATSLATLGAYKLYDYVKKNVMDPRVNEAHFQKMLDKHPRLLKENPKAVADIWQTLYRTAPTLATDATAAGAFVVHQINSGNYEQFGGPLLNTYETLAKVENAMSNDKSLAKNIDILGTTYKHLDQAITDSVKDRQRDQDKSQVVGRK